MKSHSDSSTFKSIVNQKDHLVEFMKVLSLAHECVIEEDKTKNTTFYQGPSPDETELVQFAKNTGFNCIKVDK
jgi:magnesium-transporting ATPase (P-type)